MATRRTSEGSKATATRRRHAGGTAAASAAHDAERAGVATRGRGARAAAQAPHAARDTGTHAREGGDDARRAEQGHGQRVEDRPGQAGTHAGAADTKREPRVLSAEQAIELYKANARLALDVIDAAIEGAERVRRKQFEGEQQARALSRKHARAAATATDPQALMAAGQGAAHEAMESSLRYWQEMFELITEIQRRLFMLINEQAQALPGAREAQAALALMPDLGGMQKVVQAMQAMVGSGGNAFEGVQRAMAAFAAPGSRTTR
jgi:phasin family protein